jgi:acyl transferase domain-containing protein
VRVSDDLDISSIAVIGMAGRFPGAVDLAAFWNNIVNGVESISRLSDEELLAAGVPRHEFERASYVRARGVVRGIERFDPGAYGLNQAEAVLIDPQHRVFLECAWEALEGAGYDPVRFGAAIGVYAGTARSTYREYISKGHASTGAQFQVKLGN